MVVEEEENQMCAMLEEKNARLRVSLLSLECIPMSRMTLIQEQIRERRKMIAAAKEIMSLL